MTLSLFLFYIVMADITIDDSSSYTYMQLLSERNTMMTHRTVFQELIDRYQNHNVNVPISKEFLEMHGVSKEEIEDIQQINKLVRRGKDRLQELLQEYDKCIKSIDTYNQKIKDTENKIHQFELYHRYLLDIDDRFASIVTSTENVTKLKTAVLEDLELQLASASIEKDKLEALIMSLSKTYSILRTSPLVHICPICMTNDVDIFLEPCGHTICNECISNKFCNSSKFCYMCRTSVRGIRRLYFSS